MTKCLEGRTAVITGAASGIGRASAVSFAREGANLALCDIDETGLDETVAIVNRESDVPVLARRVDARVVADLETFASAAIGRFDVIDVIDNNAGVNHRCFIEETTEEEWARIHDINAKSGFFLVKYALPALKKSERGSIINVSSGAGLYAPTDGNAVYSSSKGAIIAYTRAQARDLGQYGIRVNCIVPGPIETPMITTALAAIPEEQRDAALDSAYSRCLLKRLGQPEEVASVAVFLASSESSYVNGAIIPVNGGITYG